MYLNTAPLQNLATPQGRKTLKASPALISRPYSRTISRPSSKAQASRPRSSLSGGYRSILAPGGYAELKTHGFTRAQANLPGLLIPLCTVDGQNGAMVYRPDTPRLGRDGKAIKYEFPKGASVRLDCPPRCWAMLGDPRTPLWLTEGMKKGDALASHGLCAIALLGVWNFKGRNPFGGTTLLSDFDYIAWKGRDVRIVFDSDVMTKPQVQQLSHLHRL